MFHSILFVVVCVAVQSTLAVNQVILTCGNQQSEPTERGPPGKRGHVGRIGPIGLRGPKGEPGESDTWQSAFEEMQAKISVLETKDRLRKAANCRELQSLGQNRSGLYQIYVERLAEIISVSCDQETDGGGWLVIQRRTDGSEDFYRNWNEYRRGFGNKSNEFWLGLDIIHELTTSRSYELRVYMEDFDGGSAYAQYRSFRIGSARNLFRLEAGLYSGNAGDSLANHNGQDFTTSDQDNDPSRVNCAVNYHGAWWYENCHSSNLNGDYLLGGQNNPRGTTWHPWKSNHYSLKRVDMKIRPL